MLYPDVKTTVCPEATTVSVIDAWLSVYDYYGDFQFSVEEQQAVEEWMKANSVPKQSNFFDYYK